MPKRSKPLTTDIDGAVQDISTTLAALRDELMKLGADMSMVTNRIAVVQMNTTYLSDLAKTGLAPTPAPRRLRR